MQTIAETERRGFQGTQIWKILQSHELKNHSTALKNDIYELAKKKDIMITLFPYTMNPSLFYCIYSY